MVLQCYDRICPTDTWHRMRITGHGSVSKDSSKEILYGQTNYDFVLSIRTPILHMAMFEHHIPNRRTNMRLLHTYEVEEIRVTPGSTTMSAVFANFEVEFDLSLLYVHPLDFEAVFSELVNRGVEEMSLHLHAPPPAAPAPQDYGTMRRFRKAWVGEYPKCSICLEDFKSGEKIQTLHTKNCTFHHRCLKKWFREQNRCPNCNIPCTADSSSV